MNGYNFTERVRKSLSYAREEANELRHEYVGTEHILLGIIREGEGVASTVMRNLGVDSEALRDTIIGVVKRGNAGTATRADLPYTSRAKKVLELAMSEARELSHAYVGTEHTLLGLLREEKGVAAQVLVNSGLTLDNARAETLSVLGTAPPDRRALDESTRRKPRRPNVYIPRLARRVRDILAAAYQIATARQSPTMSPVHLAIAVLEHDGGSANAVLDRLGLDRARALASLNELAPMGPNPIQPEDPLNPSPEVSTVMGRLEELRERNGDNAAASHQLMITLVRSSREVAAVFAEQRISADDIAEMAAKMGG